VSALHAPWPLHTIVRSVVVAGQYAEQLEPHLPAVQLRVVCTHGTVPKSWQYAPQTKDVVSLHSAVHDVQVPFQHVPRPLHTLPATVGHEMLQCVDRYSGAHSVHVDPVQYPVSSEA